MKTAMTATTRGSIAATPVPRCDLQRQAASLETELMTAAQRVIRSGRYILGPECEAFAGEAAAYVGTRHAIGVASGTDALSLALTAAGIGPGDRVLTSPFTFFGTAEAILRIGAEPVFADIEPATFNLDPASVRRSLSGTSPVHRRLAIAPSTIRAIMPVHLFGLPADTEAFGASPRNTVSSSWRTPLRPSAPAVPAVRLAPSDTPVASASSPARTSVPSGTGAWSPPTTTSSPTR